MLGLIVVSHWVPVGREGSLGVSGGQRKRGHWVSLWCPMGSGVGGSMGPNRGIPMGLGWRGQRVSMGGGGGGRKGGWS